MTVKPNEVESSRAFGSGEALELDELSVLAEGIYNRNGRTTLMTLGDRGCFVVDDGEVVRCPACKVEPPIDFCGAGDTFLAGFGTLLAGGASPIQAAQVATLCSAVTIKKIGTTGTATRQEVLDTLSQTGLIPVFTGEEGTVTDQIPIASKEIARGSQVMVYLGDEIEPAQVLVPDFIGMTPEQAAEAAAEAGIYIVPAGNPDRGQPLVVSLQEPAAGTRMEKGGSITLTFTDPDARD